MKQERTTAKTVAAKRLHHGIEMKMDSVGDMSSKLDLAYCDFVEVAAVYRELCDEEDDKGYLIVNDINLDTYELHVETTYKGVISEYRNYVSSMCSAPINVPQSTVQHIPVALKKREIPTFSGKRKDWPEFKSIWNQMVVPSLLNKTALASELKPSCKGGEAFDEITNISAGIEGAYDKMWEALCLQYDNITLAVSSASGM